MRALVLLILLLAGCPTLLRPPVSEPDAQLRARKALRDLEQAGFRMPEHLDLDWSDATVRCAPGNVCASPPLLGGTEGTLVLAPEVLRSDPRLRLALLEVWQRIQDGGSMKGTDAFARSTLRQLVSGPPVGVSDPVLLREVREVYAGYYRELPAGRRGGLPDPEAYSEEIGRFLVPVPLAEPGVQAATSFATEALGSIVPSGCEEGVGQVHPGMAGWEGRQLYWRGVCAAEAGDPIRAVPYLLEAERLLPHDRRVPLTLGGVLCQAGERRAAMLAFERARRKSPTPVEQAEAYRGMARCHLDAGSMDAAGRAWRRVLRLDPEDEVTADWLRWLEERGLVRLDR